MFNLSAEKGTLNVFYNPLLKACEVKLQYFAMYLLKGGDLKSTIVSGNPNSYST
jgi:hypothetical protein